MVAPIPSSPANLPSWLAIASIIKCEWGIGMMAIPYMLQQGGLLVGALQFLGSMCLTADSIMRLIAVKKEVVKRRIVELEADGQTSVQTEVATREEASAEFPTSMSEPFVLDSSHGDGTLSRTQAEDATSRLVKSDEAWARDPLDYAGTVRAVLGPQAELALLLSMDIREMLQTVDI